MCPDAVRSPQGHRAGTQAEGRGKSSEADIRYYLAGGAMISVL
jgi:hypothetical protein